MLLRPSLKFKGRQKTAHFSLSLYFSRKQMSSSRENSPDWLRVFQAPKQSHVTLSSSSDSSPTNSPRGTKVINHKESELQGKYHNVIDVGSGEDSPLHKAQRRKASKVRKSTEANNLIDGIEEEAGIKIPAIAEEDVSEKHAERYVSSRLPLVFPEKVQRSKALVECDGEALDMSGDVGAVGRILVSNTPTGDHEMLLDLKGTIYKTTIVPSRTFCIVSFGQTEAKIEAIMNDFVQLKSHSNVYEAETMIEGTLDGFSFDSDEEADKVHKVAARKSNQNNENAVPADAKMKGKGEKSSGVVRRKAKVAGKPSKKGGRKTQISKKAKNSKK